MTGMTRATAARADSESMGESWLSTRVYQLVLLQNHFNDHKHGSKKSAPHRRAHRHPTVRSAVALFACRRTRDDLEPSRLTPAPALHSREYASRLPICAARPSAWTPTTSRGSCASESVRNVQRGPSIARAPRTHDMAAPRAIEYAECTQSEEQLAELCGHGQPWAWPPPRSPRNKAITWPADRLVTSDITVGITTPGSSFLFNKAKRGLLSHRLPQSLLTPSWEVEREARLVGGSSGEGKEGAMEQGKGYSRLVKRWLPKSLATRQFARGRRHHRLASSRVADRRLSPSRQIHDLMRRLPRAAAQVDTHAP